MTTRADDPLRQVGQSRSLGGRRATSLLACAAVALVIGLLAVPSFRAPGAPMDEGILLVYPDRILEGDVPHRDFETFYGPASFYVVAGAFSVFGASIDTEQAVGLAYDLVIVLALFALVLPWGLAPAAAAGLVAGAVTLADGVSAYAWYGALAFALTGLALAAYALRPPATRAWSSLTLFGAGLAAGAAILFRFDIALAVVLGAVPLLALMRGRRLAAYLLGLAAGVAPAVPYALVVGGDRIGEIASDLKASQAGRTLPLVPPVSPDVALLLVTTLGIASLLVAATLAIRRARGDPKGRILLALGLFAAGTYPYIFRRPDEEHLLAVAVVALAGAPLAGLVLAPGRVTAASARWRLLVAGAAASAVVLSSPLITRAAGHDLAVLLGLRAENSYAAARDGRSFFLDDREQAESVNATVAALERLAAPGDLLFVGPRDLRRTNYSDTFVYFLVPELRPASFYLELNPGAVNDPGSRLASDVAQADFLILTRRYDDWDEPNASREFGSPKPNAIVERQFCLRSRHGEYELYAHCRGGSS